MTEERFGISKAHGYMSNLNEIDPLRRVCK